MSAAKLLPRFLNSAKPYQPVGLASIAAPLVRRRGLGPGVGQSEETQAVIGLPTPTPDEIKPALTSGAASASASAEESAEPTVDLRAASTDRRARAADLRWQGWSNKKIARELGVHPSTVGRWFTAAHLPDSTNVEEATP